MTIGQKFLLFLQHRVVRGIVFVLSLIVVAGVIRSVVSIYQKRGIVAERQAVLQAEEAKHAALMQELQEATSSAFIEREAREKLGLVKPGEQVVILDQSKLLSTDKNTEGPPPPPPWEQWWQLFF